MQKNQFSEQTVLFISILKWVAIASLIGLIVGLTTTGFVKLLDFSIGNMSKYWYYLFTIPLAMFLVTIIRMYVFPKHNVETTNEVIQSIHSSASISWKSGLKAFFLPIITIAGGGSAGKEAPCADVGATTGSILSKFFKFNDADRRKLMICGVSAGFASVFGTPIAGAIFGVEVLFVGGMLYEVLLPSFIAGIVSYHVASSLGVEGFYHLINVVPDFDRTFFLTIILAGVFFGLISFLMVEFMKYSKKVSHSIKLWAPIKALAAGTVIAIIAYIFSTEYLGLGTSTIDMILQGGTIALYAFAIKIIVTGITINFGGSGGLVTPTFFIGTTAGVLFAAMLNLDPVLFAAIGLVAVLAGVANTPIAASILAIEAFGPVIAPYAAVACVISFLMTGHRSLYSNQVLSIQKSSSLKVVSGKKLGDVKTKVVVRKKGVLKYAVRAREERHKFERKYKKIAKKYGKLP
ncbi:MAG: chloride channel protein [Candidatus Nanoarchaeia archaeon]